MMIQDNDPTRSKKDVGAIVGADHDEKPKKLIAPRKEFKKVLDSDQEMADEAELTAGLVNKADDDEGGQKESMMSMFGKTYAKDKLAGSPAPKMPLNTDVEASPFVPASPKAAPTPMIQTQVGTAVDASLGPKDPDSKQPVKTENLQSPSALFGKLSTPAREDLGVNSSSEQDPLAKKGKFNLQYTTSQPDISYLNPNATVDQVNPINLAANNKIEQTVPVESPIHDLVVEMIEKLQIVQQSGQTDTVVTLNNPGIFKGAIVVMSQFDTANGQLNLAFENLTSQAKNMLDSLANRDALFNVLSEKGYTVQSFITTTIIEHQPIITTTQAETGFGRTREDGQRDNQGKKKQQ